MDLLAVLLTFVKQRLDVDADRVYLQLPMILVKDVIQYAGYTRNAKHWCCRETYDLLATNDHCTPAIFGGGRFVLQY